MTSTLSLPRFPSSALAEGPFAMAETTFAVWRGFYRAAADSAWWWTERWLQAPTFVSAWASARTAADAAQESARTAVGEGMTEEAEVALSVPEVVDVPVAVVEAVADESAAIIEAAVQPLELPADDLTQLVGIGPKLAVALAERGVTHFSQIAAWTQDDLAEVDQALSLKGRAVRDSWVAQAKRFAAPH